VITFTSPGVAQPAPASCAGDGSALQQVPSTMPPLQRRRRRAAAMVMVLHLAGADQVYDNSLPLNDRRHNLSYGMQHSFISAVPYELSHKKSTVPVPYNHMCPLRYGVPV
jgi:hypothetical protein